MYLEDRACTPVFLVPEATPTWGYPDSATQALGQPHPRKRLTAGRVYSTDGAALGHERRHQLLRCARPAGGDSSSGSREDLLKRLLATPPDADCTPDSCAFASPDALGPAS
jgi:hypothetical protein